MSEARRVPPIRPCYVIFEGLRHTPRPGYVEQIHEPVRVIEVTNGKEKELAVCMFGRSTKWPLHTFEGTWTKIDVEEREAA